jgi:hypothetical protein
MQIPDQQLKQQILSEFELSGKNRIVLMNNVPLVVVNNQLHLEYESWDRLPYHSLKLVCEIAKEVKASGKKASLIFFADDYTYGHPEASWYQTLRSKFYKQYNGKVLKLPEVVGKLFNQYDLRIDDIIRSDHGKKNRENCLYFSEVSLRHKRQEIENPCARELMQVFSDKNYFCSENDHLVLLILSMCQRGVCDSAIPQLKKELSNFTETTIVFNYDRDFNIYRGIL